MIYVVRDRATDRAEMVEAGSAGEAARRWADRDEGRYGGETWRVEVITLEGDGLGAVEAMLEDADRRAVEAARVHLEEVREMSDQLGDARDAVGQLRREVAALGEIVETQREEIRQARADLESAERAAQDALEVAGLWRGVAHAAETGASVRASLMAVDDALGEAGR